MAIASLLQQAASPAVLAMGFAVVLVLSLVAAEEVELRRGTPSIAAED